MRKTIATVLSLLLFALPLAAGSYTLTTTAGADATLADIVADTNEATCLYYGQAVGCTQAQARKEFCRRAGVGGVTTCVPNTIPGQPPVCTTTPLTATCDGSNQVDIYADVQSFLQRETLRLIKDEYGPKSTAKRAAQFVKNPATATTAQKNAWCQMNNLPNGCIP